MTHIKIIYHGHRDNYTKPQILDITRDSLDEAKQEVIKLCRDHKWEPQYCESIVEGLTYIS